MDNDKDQDIPQNAGAEFTQDNCDNLTDYTKWKVPQFTQFRKGEKWPCSFAGTLPSDKDLGDSDVADAQH